VDDSFLEGVRDIGQIFLIFKKKKSNIQMIILTMKRTYE